MLCLVWARKKYLDLCKWAVGSIVGLHKGTSPASSWATGKPSLVHVVAASTRRMCSVLLGVSVSPCRRRRCYLSRARALDGIRRVAEERNVTGPARELGGPMSGRMAAVSPLPGTEDVATELGSGQRRRLFQLRISLARRAPPVPRVRRPSRSSKAHASCIRSSSETWARVCLDRCASFSV